MKTLKLFLVVQLSLITFYAAFSQDITADTILANQYFTYANELLNYQNFDSAVYYLNKAQPLYIKHLGEKSLQNADVLDLMGTIANNKFELDKALDYFYLSLAIRKELLGEKNAVVANSYSNIGNVYPYRSEYRMNLEYHLKSLDLRKELFGEKHIDVAKSLLDIGIVYKWRNEPDKALDYTLQSVELFKNKLGSKNVLLAKAYGNIAAFYYYKLEYKKALEYAFKKLTILKESVDKKDTELAYSYLIIGLFYQKKNDYSNALLNYQRGIASCFFDFNDTTNVQNIPNLKNFLNVRDLVLRLLLQKAQVYSAMSNVAQNPEVDLQTALRHYQVCNILIDKLYKNISVSDKMSLNERAHHVYRGIGSVYMRLLECNEVSPQKAKEYKQLAFYYSEKCKSPVLQQEMAEQDALKSAGIPDSLLQKEHKLKMDIAFYTKQLVTPENLDSTKTTLFRSKLFHANRSYDSLIIMFEKQYPNYEALKNNNNIVSVEKLQKTVLKDGKTAIIAHLISDIIDGDSILTIFTITNKTIDVKKVVLPKISIGSDPFDYFHHICSSPNKKLHSDYNSIAFDIYNTFIPGNINKKIKNLIIIPDLLSRFPYEALLTKKVDDKVPFKDFPFLIRDYNISYSYSATLLEHIFTNVKPLQTLHQQESDWIGIAPIFDGVNKKAVTSNKLMVQLRNINKKNTLNGEVLLINGDSIPVLPASEDEVESIFSQFNQLKYKAKIALRNDVNEQFIKSGGLENFKIIHFATHGFVNTEEPELSAILLAQDSTCKQDGILFAGEISNLKLKSDLVTLSACETGLGRQYDGEGIVGLTRAFLYAGAKNIIVSLWQVNDKSTSDLMIDFYKGILTKRKNQNYSQSLRKAKLKMIDEGKFSNPFYWSPFILIGK